MTATATDELTLEELEKHFTRVTKEYKERKIYRDHNDRLWYDSDGIINLYNKIKEMKEEYNG